MLPLAADVADIIALSAAGVAVVALLVALVAVARLRRVRRSVSVLDVDGDQANLLEVVARQAADIGALRGEVEAIRGQLRGVRGEVADALRHVAVVRYDAFQDMGGRLSFSAALLDDAGDGLVLTAINGRSETRSYAKGVKAGASEHQLSPEEQQAVDYALRGVRKPAVPA